MEVGCTIIPRNHCNRTHDRIEHFFCETKSCWYLDYSNEIYTHTLFLCAYCNQLDIPRDQNCDLPGLDADLCVSHTDGHDEIRRLQQSMTQIKHDEIDPSKQEKNLIQFDVWDESTMYRKRQWYHYFAKNEKLLSLVHCRSGSPLCESVCLVLLLTPLTYMISMPQKMQEADGLL